MGGSGRVRADGLAIGTEVRVDSIAKARRQIAAMFEAAAEAA